MPALDALAERYPQVQFVFLYTREAHPAETIPAHTSLEDKLACARRLVKRWNLKRRVLVDTLEGDLHRAFGSLPNMSWVLSRTGRVVYKASWTDDVTIELAVRQLVVEEEQKRAGARHRPYTVQWQPRRVRDISAFMDGLQENGPRAVDEFIDALNHTYGEGASREHRAWRTRRDAGKAD